MNDVIALVLSTLFCVVVFVPLAALYEKAKKEMEADEKERDE